MKFVVVFLLLVVKLICVDSAAYAIDSQLFKPESGAFSVIAPGKVKLNRLREDNRLIHEYNWTNGLNTLLIIGEGVELEKDQGIVQFVDNYLEKVKRPNFLIVREEKSKGSGWFGQKLFFYRETTKDLEQVSLIAMSQKKDVVYVLTAKPLNSDFRIDKILAKQFFESFEVHPEAATQEQKSKDMNSLGYSIGPIIVAFFLFGFVFTIFFVIGVILYRMRQS